MSPVPRSRASVKRCGGGKHLPSIGHLEYFWPGRFVLLFEKSPKIWLEQKNTHKKNKEAPKKNKEGGKGV